MKFAIIDIGSNSVRLMLSADGNTLYKKVTTTRLGSNLAESGSLSEAAIIRSVNAVAEFCEEAKSASAQIYAFATAAVRSAKNGGLFCQRVKDVCGITVEIISGQDEALLGVLGALGERNGGIVDIGGASTEVCFRENGKTVFSVSMDIGAVRLFDLCGNDREKLKAEVEASLLSLNGANTLHEIYAIGGTASTLASVKLGLSEYDAAKLNGLTIESDWLEETANRLLAMTVQERKEIAGMDVARADVIGGAAYLLSEITKKLCCKKIRFSDRDNLEGFLIYRGLI